jgi:hypothetical protein
MTMEEMHLVKPVICNRSLTRWPGIDDFVLLESENRFARVKFKLK